jgi:alpha-L-arabinofuranosidase
MLEMYCRSDIWKMCRDFTGTAPLVQLRSISGSSLVAWEYDLFYDGISNFEYIWLPQYESKRVHNDSFRKAAGIFSRNGSLLFRAFLRELYDGDIKKAILGHRCFEDLFDDFTNWFQERKKAFMDKTAELILQIKPELKDIKKISTHSHGGVVNLLKVLTKTMHEQGSTIKTIAKVQYAICLQAGIYVPEEFMTDVLTAADIDPNVWEGSGVDESK